MSEGIFDPEVYGQPVNTDTQFDTEVYGILGEDQFSGAFGQAQAFILGNTHNAYGQCQADILHTYQAYGQASCDIKQTYQGYAQCQADIKQTYQGYGQCQALIANKYNVYGQSQAYVLQDKVFGQCQAQISRPATPVYGQANAYVTPLRTSATGGNATGASFTLTLNNLQKDDLILLHIGRSNSLVSYTLTNDAGLWEDVPARRSLNNNLLDQRNYYVPSGISSVTFTLQASTAVTLQAIGAAYRAGGGLIYNVHVINSNTGSGSANLGVGSQTWIKGQELQVATTANSNTQPVTPTTGQGIEVTEISSGVFVLEAQYNGHVTANNDLSASVPVISSFGTIVEMFVKAVPDNQGYSQAQAQITNSYQVYGQAQGKINAFDVTRYGQAQSDIVTSYQTYGQCQAHIVQTYNGYGQAQSQIINSYQSYSQAQGEINQTYNTYGQSQATIKITGYGVGQSQGEIFKVINAGWGQATADILSSSYKLAHVTANIDSPIKLRWATTQGYIYKDIGYGQAQAFISHHLGPAQAQAQLKRTNNRAHACARAFLINRKKHGHAMADIKKTTRGYALAVGFILHPRANGQARAYINPGKSNVYGQANAYLWPYQFAQAQAMINPAKQYGQAQAQIKYLKLRGFGQAQAVLGKGYGFGQAQAKVLGSFARPAQANAKIAAPFSYGQAQGRISRQGTLLYDTFTRTTAFGASFGTPSYGPDWTNSFGDTDGGRIDGSKAFLDYSRTGGFTYFYVRNPINTNNVDFYAEFLKSTPADTATYFGARDNFTWASYQYTTGQWQVVAWNGSSYTITNTSYTILADTWYSIRLKEVFNNVSFKIWVKDTPEPDAWLVTITNAVNHAGYVELYFDNANASNNTTGYAYVDNVNVQYGALYGWGQAQATINQPNPYQFGQAQGYISQPNVWGQAQATIKRQGDGQAQAYISTRNNKYAQAMAHIVGNTGYGQSQAFIIQSIGFGQAQAKIAGHQHGLAMARIRLREGNTQDQFGNFTNATNAYVSNILDDFSESILIYYQLNEPLLTGAAYSNSNMLYKDTVWDNVSLKDMTRVNGSLGNGPYGGETKLVPVTDDSAILSTISSSGSDYLQYTGSLPLQGSPFGYKTMFWFRPKEIRTVGGAVPLLMLGNTSEIGAGAITFKYEPTGLLSVYYGDGASSTLILQYNGLTLDQTYFVGFMYEGTFNSTNISALIINDQVVDTHAQILTLPSSTIFIGGNSSDTYKFVLDEFLFYGIASQLSFDPVFMKVLYYIGINFKGGFGQAQALIINKIAFGQAQADIKNGFKWAQANAYIITHPRKYAQAQAAIFGAGFRAQVGQAQAYIDNGQRVVGQSQAYISSKRNSYGQARAYLSIPKKHAQAQALILGVNQPITVANPFSPPTYIVSYSNYHLPGYAQEESMDSPMGIKTFDEPYQDISFSEYTGLENKLISLRMKVVGENYIDCKNQVQLAATILRVNRHGFSPLYIQYPDRHFEAIPQSIKLEANTGNIRTADYTVEFEAKPWVVADQLTTISGVNSIVATRTLYDGTWTPATVRFTGTNVTVSGYTGTETFTGFISVSGVVNNFEIDTENYASDEPALLSKDYQLYIGPGTTYFTITGASDCTITYRNRWNL